MSRRHALPARWPVRWPVRWPQRPPAIWLFTDARMGDALYAAIARLPKGKAGVVYRWGHEARIRALCRRRRLVFVDERTPGGLIARAHNRRELVAARREGARLVFLSPVFATRTHPGARVLGRVRFGLLARRAGVTLGALGGVNARRFQALRQTGATAWGGIDALIDAAR